MGERLFWGKRRRDGEKFWKFSEKNGLEDLDHLVREREREQMLVRTKKKFSSFKNPKKVKRDCV